MSRQRWVGLLFGLLAYLGILVAALLSTLEPSSTFSGAQGIENSVRRNVEAVVDDIGGRVVRVDDRDVTVELPDVLPAGLSHDVVEDQIKAIDGVRKLTITSPSGAGATAVAPPSPTLPAATTAPAPTAVAPPTATEPAATPVPTPAALSADEIVGGIDLSAVRFEPGTAQLTDADRVALDAAAANLIGLSSGLIEVQAHTSDEGDPDVNLLLSQDRATAVVGYLIERGVDPAILYASGYGGALPIADNSTEQGRAANERVALVVEGN